MKKADGSGALLALVIGEDELRSGEITLKYLRRDRPQTRIRRESLAAGFVEALAQA
jgi:histidyl-tRNA synthetase